jgi:N-acetylglutamate synthase-like GNAT family acetyltransferase
MAVREDLHRKGAGRALLERTVSDLTSAGLRLLMVKTLAPSDPDEGYRKTRAFYTSMGFLPLEETQEWGPENPCLVMVKVLEASDGR